jgi:hypothetical protein
VVVLKHLLRGLHGQNPGVGVPSIQRAIGWMIAASQARAEFGWANSKSLWRDFEQVRPSKMTRS